MPIWYRLAPGTGRKQCARDVDHMARACALVDQRRPTATAKAARTTRGFILIAGDFVLSLSNPKALAPGPNIGRINGTMRGAAGARVIVPGPERRKVDLEAHVAAQTLAFHA